MTDLARRKRSAEFVRGFFLQLRQKQVPAVVLHGGEDGFEGELSDVDFVTDHTSFKSIASIVNAYCDASGWQLCQVLRHETTAAYCVCSATDDPSCAVALDACSDYQRNGTPFLAADDLLENPRLLAWGGFGLPHDRELRYRFAKAAAKRKDANSVALEFSRYSSHVRENCEMWLLKRWGVHLNDWSAPALNTALQQIGQQSHPKPPLFRLSSVLRIAGRISNPAGVVVTTGSAEFNTRAALLESVFSHLYFRRFLKTDRWKPSLIKNLIASTLIVTPELGTSLFPGDCVYRLDPNVDPQTLCREFANRLHRRCMRREGL